MRWLPVVGVDRYEVSDHGDVRSWRNGAGGVRATPLMLRQYPKPSGHRYVVLTLEGSIQKHFYVHRLVLTAFSGQAPEGTECCHADRDPANNYIANLRWATHKENGADMTKHGIKAGEHHHMAKLSEEKVRQIRAEPEASARNLARRFGVDTRTIHRVRSGANWRQVAAA